MIWVIIITDAVLILTGIAVLHGKCDDIIAGYSTMPAEKRQQYDTDRLRILVAGLFFTEAALFFLWLIEAEWTKTVFLAASVASIVIYAILTHTWVKRK